MNEWNVSALCARLARTLDEDGLDILGTGSGGAGQDGVDLFGVQQPDAVPVTRQSAPPEATNEVPSFAEPLHFEASPSAPPQGGAKLDKKAKKKPKPAVARPVRQDIYGANGIVVPGLDDDLTSSVSGHVTMYLSRSRHSLKGEHKIENRLNGFRIGRAEDNDMVLTPDTISRRHAEIVFENGQYFVRDVGATNHIYVDGEMLQSHVRTPLSHGSALSLADQDFYVWIVTE